MRSNLEPGTLNLEQALKMLLASPNICSKHWVYEQYDTMVRTNTAVLPGADAAVIRVKETRRAIAMCLDGNGTLRRGQSRKKVRNSPSPRRREMSSASVRSRSPSQIVLILLRPSGLK